MGGFGKGSRAWGISDRSGFRYLLKDMRKEWTGLLVGPDEWEPKHPQLIRKRRANDKQALKNASPDRKEPVDFYVGVPQLPGEPVYSIAAFGKTSSPEVSIGEPEFIGLGAADGYVYDAVYGSVYSSFQILAHTYFVEADRSKLQWYRNPITTSLGKWTNEPSTSGNTYYVRYYRVSGFAFYTTLAANVWHPLTSYLSFGFAWVGTGQYRWEMATDSAGTNIVSSATQTITLR